MSITLLLSNSYTVGRAKRDTIHEAVKNALIKDGWTITDDPYRIEYEEVKLYADLAAERPFAAERAGQKIVVEVKSFLNLSPIHDFEMALGQYNVYRELLTLVAPERKLYLAVSHLLEDNFLSGKAIQLIIHQQKLSLVLINIADEEINKWIS
ncbi:MAG: element excision factor XisH family protein [Acidobacteriota bacterium]